MEAKVVETINSIPERSIKAQETNDHIRDLIEGTDKKEQELFFQLNELLTEEVKNIAGDYLTEQKKKIVTGQVFILISLVLVVFNLFTLFQSSYLGLYFSVFSSVFPLVTLIVSFSLYSDRSKPGTINVPRFVLFLGIASAGYYLYAQWPLLSAGYVDAILRSIFLHFLPAIVILISSGVVGDLIYNQQKTQSFIDHIDFNSNNNPNVPEAINQKVNHLRSSIDKAINKENQSYSSAREIFDFIDVIEREMKNKADEMRNAIENAKKELEITETLYTSFPEVISTTHNLKSKPNHINFPIPTIRIGNRILNIHGFDKLTQPVTIGLVNTSNLIFEYASYNYNTVKNIVNQLITRMLLSVKPNKMKLVCIDPVGLGANFSHFTSLDKKIFGGKVWVEEEHIMQQLVKLSNHIEKIIQDYLQDKYHNILHYNSNANEVEEPYYLLVIHNFPEGLNERILKKLKSVMENGPTRGVCTILLHETGTMFPYGSSYDQFTNSHVNTVINIQNYYTSILPERLTTEFQLIPWDNIPTIIDRFNQEFDSVRNDTTKVYFTDYLLPKNEWWKSDCSDIFEIKIGKSGANDEQRFFFDNKDKPNALMVGRPGSGKSNLLHIIVLSAITKYSPSELSVFLIDFKGGVEFVPYAEKVAPHLRTIAVASDREFGLSILKGLERELLQRENLFRERHVTNLSQFRTAFPNEYLPRVLFIADEFQEFFTYRDTISDNAQVIFERIIRKGRAFGINILLSSQSLSSSGGDRLQRNTINLIPVRIALMCSIADSREILAEGNEKAQFLQKPGEGIYNSSNGLVEGNENFQAFFLEREEINSILDDIQTLHTEINLPNPVIFRGDNLPRLSEQPAFANLSVLPPYKSPKISIGNPVSMDLGFSISLSKSSGSNILLTGSNGMLAGNIMSSTITSLILSTPHRLLDLYYFDFTDEDSDDYGALVPYFDAFSGNSRQVSNVNLSATLKEVSKEVNNRIAGTSKSDVRKVLIFSNIQRARKIRAADYGEDPVEENDLLISILKNGPDVGIHVIVQIDNQINFERVFDNKLREFSYRIIMQTSESDSIYFIKNNGALKLSNRRALFYNDTDGTLVKIIPFEKPSVNWFEKIHEQQISFTN